MAETGAYNDFIMRQAHDNGQVSEEDYNKYQAASHSQKTGIAAGHAASMAADIHRQLQTADIGEKQAATEAAQEHVALLKAQREQTGPYAPSPYAQQPIWADDGTGKYMQVGLHDEQGNPHFFPYGRAGGSNAQPFAPAPEITKAMNDAGYIYAPTSRNSGRWINNKGQADLDENGMPIYSTDGAMVQSGGKMKPVTAGMAIAKADYEARKAASAPTPIPGPGIIQRIFGDGNAPTRQPPAATPAPTPITSKADYDALPSGSIYTAPDRSTRRKPSAPAGGAPNGKIRVVSPQGTPVFIPANRLKDYLAAGYTKG